MSVLFDLDGTLLDTAIDFIDILELLKKHLDLDITINPQAVRLAIPYGANAIIKAGLGLDDPRITAQFLEAYTTSPTKAQLFEGMDELLNQLDQERILWGIVTNKASRYTTPLLDELNLSKRASCVVSGDTTPYQKPHPEPLLHACSLLNVDPKSCVYIGDHQRDIDAGKNAGMKTIAALFGYVDPSIDYNYWGADHYAYHAQDIYPWIKEWQKTLNSN